MFNVLLVNVFTLIYTNLQLSYILSKWALFTLIIFLILVFSPFHIPPQARTGFWQYSCYFHALWYLYSFMVFKAYLKMETDKNDLHKDWIKIAWHSMQEIMNCKNLKVCNKCFSSVKYLKEHIKKLHWLLFCKIDFRRKIFHPWN